MADLIGKRISQRYAIEELIGGGGMAHVYLGRDVILEREVAVKVLQPQYNKDEEFIRRFHREAQAATSLAHPNIVNIYDAGEEEDLYYIVMEYVKGKTLKKKVQEEGPLPLSQAVDLMKQILCAINHAHANEIIHRDIKPHNILLNEKGEAKVTDFGIARAASAATITHTNSVMGSVHYLSPEQARGGVITSKSDVYSLGVVLYEMVTGTLPYDGDSAVSIALKHLQEPLPLPSDKRPGLPQSLENVILKATSKNPFDRYESVEDMKEDLSTVLSEERRNEAPLIVPFDDDATKAIPLIKDDEASDQTMEHGISKNETIVTEPLSDQVPAKPVKKKKKKRAGIILLILMLMFGAALAAFTWMPGILRVQDTEVPETVGMPLEEAEEEMEEAGLETETEMVFHNEVEEDHIVSQNPQAGRSVKVDSTVMLRVSEGPETIEMPDVTGMDQEAAEEELSEFEGVEFREDDSGDAPPGEVTGQDPTEGDTIVPSETTVTLMYSVEREFTMHNLEGESREAVETYLENYNLEGAFESSSSDSVEEGRVIEHSPGPYHSVTEGDTVEFIVSSGPEEIEDEPDENSNDEDESSEDGGEENEDEQSSEQVEAVIPVEVDESDEEEGREFNIRIEYEDATTEEPETFTEETITETKTYRVPLEVTPETDGTYTLYVDDEEVQSNSFSYGD
ncbi:Stk1 family PASTA domain-containing Ser/Thr kinase [Alteribacillus sp. HJP-4]|uniref:Stk1 family PASTA domain-containing Ser/Thr kinase n=1 Tax=Alteribacillus sp. HJP-4 TaxID=2775394 RepID=UPI0035CCF0AE